MGNYLLTELKIRFCAFRVAVVEFDGFSVAGRLGETNIAWNHRFENLLAIKVPQIRGLRVRQDINQINVRRRFTDSPLLICYCSYTCHRGETYVTGGHVSTLA